MFHRYHRDDGTAGAGCGGDGSGRDEENVFRIRFPVPLFAAMRRTAAYLAGMGAVVAGAVSTALIVAVPLQPRSNSDPALSCRLPVSRKTAFSRR